MKYKIECELWFDNEADARSVYNAAKNAFGKAKSSNDTERKRINIHKCFHDERPFKPCEPIEEEFDAEIDRAPILG